MFKKPLSYVEVLPVGGIFAVDEAVDDLPFALKGGLLVELALDGLVDVLIGVGVEVGGGGQTFYLLEEEIGEEAMMLSVE